MSRGGRQARLFQLRRKTMNWTTPKLVEIALGAEINAYACADVK